MIWTANYANFIYFNTEDTEMHGVHRQKHIYKKLDMQLTQLDRQINLGIHGKMGNVAKLGMGFVPEVSGIDAFAA